jgi:REP element-mobilizing transposase RayT
MATKQQGLPLPATWGGKRKGAGRPKRGFRASERHETRARLLPSQPVHVTMRCAHGVPNLRCRAVYRAIRWATISAADRGDAFRIVHVSIQRTHVHMLVEATHRMALARGMQGFASSAARLINSATGHRGQVFADRYHPHILKTPSEVRHALAYVLNNWRRHGEDRGKTWLVDPFSTGIRYPGWYERRGLHTLYRQPPQYEALCVWLPKTWLLAQSWRTRPLVSTTERPGPRR